VKSSPTALIPPVIGGTITAALPYAFTLFDEAFNTLPILVLAGNDMPRFIKA
jgi:hypothetical protein